MLAISGLPPTALKGMTILVVEDEPLIGFDIMSCLEDHGAEVLGPCATVADALRTLRAAERIDCATLDFKLQRGELSLPIACALVERAIPHLFLSASIDEVLRHYPAASYLSKPFQPDQLPVVLRLLTLNLMGQH